jgi:hypothetical protein
MGDRTSVHFDVWKESDRYKLLIRLPGDADSYEIDLPITWQTLDARLRTVRGTLNEIVGQVGNRVTLSHSEKEAILVDLANEGFDAFADWVGDSGEAFSLVSSVLKDFQAVGGIYIHARDFQLPWEILTIDPTMPHFWGFDHVVHHQLPINGRTYNRNRGRIELENNGPLEIGLLALQDVGLLPAIIRHEIPFFQGLDREGVICCEIMESLDPNPDKEKRKDEIHKLKAFVDRKERHIYHLACHILPDDQNPSRSSFLITDWFPVSPDDLRRERIEFKGASLVVLNACSTAKIDPFHTSDLVSNLLRGDIQGILATQCEIPDSFASAFVKEFYVKLLAGEEIGDALRLTRTFFLEQHNNPLGLLYSLYQISPRWHISKRKLPANE